MSDSVELIVVSWQQTMISTGTVSLGAPCAFEALCGDSARGVCDGVLSAAHDGKLP